MDIQKEWRNVCGLCIVKTSDNMRQLEIVEWGDHRQDGWKKMTMYWH